LNHGYFNAAREAYETVLKLEPDVDVALNGWTTTLCSARIWDSEKASNDLCEMGVEAILAKTTQELQGDLTTKALGQSYNALWALCWFNGPHTEVILDYPGFVASLVHVLDACIAKKAADTALMCIGVSRSVCDTPQGKNMLIQADVPDRIPKLLEVYADDAHVLIQTAYWMEDLAQDDALEIKMAESGALERVVDRWRKHHMHDPVVCYTIPQTLHNFTFSCENQLRNWGVPDLTREAMRMHPNSVVVPKRGQDLLDQFQTLYDKAEKRATHKAQEAEIVHKGLLKICRQRSSFFTDLEGC
jgi:hypothetical protein